jgi:hypothetical protein
MARSVADLAGAEGIEPSHGGIKIADRDNKFNADSDSSCCVHVQADQGVSRAVGTAKPSHQYDAEQDHPKPTEPSSRQRTAHQMEKIWKEIAALITANVPVDELRPIDVIRRLQDSMKFKGMLPRELPGTRTFYRCLAVRRKSNAAQRSDAFRSDGAGGTDGT